MRRKPNSKEPQRIVDQIKGLRERTRVKRSRFGSQFKVQMSQIRPTRVSHVGDVLPLGHHSSYTDGDRIGFQVGIAGVDLVAVLNYDVVSPATAALSEVIVE